MAIDQKVLYYGLLYLYEREQFNEGLEYINENRVELIDELQSEQYLDLVEVLFKIRADKGINSEAIYLLAKKLDFSAFNADDKDFAFCVIFYTIAFIFIDYTKANLLSDPFVKDTLDLISSYVIQPLDQLYPYWKKSVKIWNILTEEDRNTFIDSTLPSLKNVLNHCLSLYYLKKHLFA